MKSKASLFLMEQLVMILVFALAAALCLGIFVRADSVSEDIRRRDAAVVLARNGAELLKATGDPAQVLKQLEHEEFTLTIREEASGIAGLKQATVAVLLGEKEIFSLQTGWQEVGQ